MFSFLKGNTDDVKGIRVAILQFIKEQLQKMESGEGRNINGLNLYVNATSNEQHLYEAAVYANDENRFKEAIQKMVDDYALALHADWSLSVLFTNNWPAATLKADKIKAGLAVTTNKKPSVVVQKNEQAIIKLLNGEAEKCEYHIASQKGNINIGREAKVTTAAGFTRQNHIAFAGNSNNESNRSVSRQHAHIEWNEAAHSFLLFADEGGIPPNNKTKIKPEAGEAIKLQSTATGHRLSHGDQIILGESAMLGFITMQAL